MLLVIIGLALGAWMAWLDSAAAELTLPIALIEIALMPAIVHVAFLVFFFGRAPRGDM